MRPRLYQLSYTAVLSYNHLTPGRINTFIMNTEPRQGSAGGKAHKHAICYVCAYSRHIEIAHKKPIKEFAGSSLISEINSLNNLVALCNRCHWEYDNGYFCLTGSGTPNRTAFEGYGPSVTPV